jgi:hypothetical protein
MSKRRSERAENELDSQFELSRIEGEITSQSSVLNQMQRAMDELPSQIQHIQQRLDRLSASMEGVPAVLEEKGTILAEVDTFRMPQAPKKELKPDWGLEADVRVGRTLRVSVYATFALGNVTDAPHDPCTDLDLRLHRILDRKWMTQQPETAPNQSKRTKIEVYNIQVQKCRIRGAPQDAERTMILSPEAGIPIVLLDDDLCFDFAPALTIKNEWEGAETPSFRPMGEEIRVPLEDFEKRHSISRRLALKDQDQRMTVRLHCEPLRES